jgi:hypothetical protein
MDLVKRSATTWLLEVATDAGGRYVYTEVDIEIKENGIDIEGHIIPWAEIDAAKESWGIYKWEKCKHINREPLEPNKPTFGAVSRCADCGKAIYAENAKRNFDDNDSIPAEMLRQRQEAMGLKREIDKAKLLKNKSTQT